MQWSTGLEPSEARADASGPAAVEDAHGAIAVARVDEPPRFPHGRIRRRQPPLGVGLELRLCQFYCCAWRRGKW